MRTDRLLELADKIEGLKHFDDFDGLAGTLSPTPLLPEKDRYSLFHMNWWQFQCKAPCCTAGWADYLWGDDDLDDYADEDWYTSVENRAKAALGLDWNTASALFRPEVFDLKTSDHEAYLHKLTPQVVARALRHLAETGDVVFEL